MFPPEFHNEPLIESKTWFPGFTTCVTIEIVILYIAWNNCSDPINLMKYCRVNPRTFCILTNFKFELQKKMNHQHEDADQIHLNQIDLITDPD